MDSFSRFLLQEVGEEITAGGPPAELLGGTGGLSDPGLGGGGNLGQSGGLGGGMDASLGGGLGSGFGGGMGSNLGGMMGGSSNIQSATPIIIDDPDVWEEFEKLLKKSSIKSGRSSE